MFGLVEQRALGVHDGNDLRAPVGAAHLIVPIDRSRLLVERVELPRERVMVIGEGAELLHALCTRRIRVGPGVHLGRLHLTALPSLAIRVGAAMRAVYLAIPRASPRCSPGCAQWLSRARAGSDTSRLDRR